MIDSKCSEDASNDGFAATSLLQTGLITIGFGAYMGLVLHSKMFNGQKGLVETESGG
jgi:hypothetical protein